MTTNSYDLNKMLPGVVDTWRDGMGCRSCGRHTPDPIAGHDGFCPVPALFTLRAEVERLRAKRNELCMALVESRLFVLSMHPGYDQELALKREAMIEKIDRLTGFPLSPPSPAAR